MDYYSEGIFRDNNYRIDRKNPFPGIYRGRVEYRKDPFRLGRIKVRIPSRHGVPGIDNEDEVISVEDLPWAWKKGSIHGGYDMGSFIIPPVGSFVWVEYEAGNPDKFVYSGGVEGRNSKKVHSYGIFEDVLDENLVAGGSWDAPLGDNEIPKDVFDGKDSDEPYRNIIYKSLKGHTFMTDEEDEKESMSLIDRAGQVFKMISPIKDSENHTGDSTFQRGTKDSIKENQLDNETQSYMQKAVMIMKDLSNQIIRSVAEWGKEKLEIVSRNKEGSRQSVHQLNAGDGNINQLILSEDKNSGNKVYINADAVNLKLELVVVENGNEISRIEMTDNIKEYATGSMEIQSGKIMRLHSNLDLNVSADGGKLEVKSSGDLNIESGGHFNEKATNNLNRQAGSSINDMAGGDINHDGTNTYLQSGTSGSADSYGGNIFDYSPLSDDKTWIDNQDEKFIEG